MIITRTQEAGDAIPGNKSASPECDKCKHILKENTENWGMGEEMGNTDIKRVKSRRSTNKEIINKGSKELMESGWRKEVEGGMRKKGNRQNLGKGENQES